MTSSQAHVLSLQQTAGNRAVTELLALQRKKASAQPKSKKRKAGVENYVAFINALEWLGANHETIRESGPFAFAKFITLGLDSEDLPHLLPQHSELLLGVVKALKTRGHDEWGAFEKWQELAPTLRSEANAMFAFMKRYPKTDLSETRKVLPILDEYGFPVKNAYAALRAQKKQERRPHAPDQVKLGDLKNATEAFFEANKLYEDTAKLASSVVSIDNRRTVEIARAGVKPAYVGPLIDILSSTLSAEQKLEEARKNLGVFSAADFLNKIMGATSGTLKAGSEIGVIWSGKMIEIAKAKGLSKDVVRYTAANARFAKYVAAAEKVNTAATALSMAANYAKLFKAVWTRDWDEALASGADLGLDIAGVTLGGGAAGAAMIAGSVVIVKAQLEAVHLAAEFIRWCRDETVRQAAEKFVKDATVIAKGPAWDLVANAEIVVDPDKAAVHEIASQQMEISAKKVAKGFRHLDSHVTATVKTAIGGHGAVVLALGSDARRALAMPADDVLNIADQVDVVFKGVDSMARYVKAKYTN